MGRPWVGVRMEWNEMDGMVWIEGNGMEWNVTMDPLVSPIHLGLLGAG